MNDSTLAAARMFWNENGLAVMDKEIGLIIELFSNKLKSDGIFLLIVLIVLKQG